MTALLAWLIGLPILLAVLAFAALGLLVYVCWCLIDAMFPGGLWR